MTHDLDQRTNYLDLTDYVVVKEDYHEYIVACTERAKMKLEQLTSIDNKDRNSERNRDRVRLLGWVLATEDAL